MRIVFTEGQQEYFTKMGKHFGYPQCCIDEFLICELPRPIRQFNGTGYIPCAKCNEKTEQELLDIIASNRIHPQPFPQDGWTWKRSDP